MTPAWIESVKAKSLAEAAQALGMRAGRNGFERSFGPCPACSAESRGSADRRPPLVSGKAKGWHCLACDAKGDAVDLVAWAKLQARTRDLGRDQLDKLRVACVELGLCEAGQFEGEGPTGGKSVSTRQIVDDIVAGVRRKRRMGGNAAPQPGADAQGGAQAAPEPAAAQGPQSDDLAALAEQCEAALWSPEGAPVLRYLREVRGLSEQTCRDWHLGAHLKRSAEPAPAAPQAERQPGDESEAVPAADPGLAECWLAIPLRDQHGVVRRLKYRAIPGIGDAGLIVMGGKSIKYRVTAGSGDLPLFGSDRLDPNPAAPLTIAEGELDVVTYWEYGIRNVVSGTAGAGTFVAQEGWLDLVEPYRTLILALDDDEAGEAGAQAIAEKLGRPRCHRAKLPRKDAGDCLAAGIPADEVAACLEHAAPMVDFQLLQADSYAAELEALIEHPETLVGTRTGSLKLDRVVGGIRPGLYAVTGESGKGKTSFVTWLLAEQARQGIPTLITSFEQRPIGSVQKLLRQQLGDSFLKVDADARLRALQELAALPLWILNHRGHFSSSKMVEVIEYAVRRKGVRRVMIDHLGFIIDSGAKDERREIDNVIRGLSMLGEHHNCAIFLICHPSNPPQQGGKFPARRVKLEDIKGASSIRQDAHEGWVVVKREPTQAYPCGCDVYIDKARSEFAMPTDAPVTLAFDPVAISYHDSWADTPCARRGVMPVVPRDESAKRKKKPKSKPAAKAEEPADPVDGDEGVDAGAAG